jgi:hypothetical protein
VVTSSDDGGPATVSCVRTGDGSSIPVPADGTAIFYPLGSWQVSCTATDASGNQASAGFPVSVNDTQPPTLDVSGLSISLAFTTGGAIVSYNSSAATATDVVDVTPTVQCTPSPGTFVPLGPAEVTCTATDDSGNTATARRSFVVADTAAPVLTLPAPMTVEATSAAGAAVTYAATALDAVDPTPTVVCVPPSGATFPFGTTQVSCTATDDAGNQSAGSFAVTVVGITATVSPELLWPPNGAIIPVTVSGQAFAGGSGVVAIEWRVVDEYRQHQPTGSASVAGNGPFSFQVPLLADRRGSDKDGRHYSIRLTAVDQAGNRLLLAQPLVVNVHDQGGD